MSNFPVNVNRLFELLYLMEESLGMKKREGGSVSSEESTVNVQSLLYIQSDVFCCIVLPFNLFIVTVALLLHRILCCTD